MTEPTNHISPPLLRRLWLVIALTCLIFTFPIALLILLTGKVYRWRETGWAPISDKARWIYAGALGLWLFAAIANFAMSGKSGQETWKENQVVTSQSRSEALSGGANSEAPSKSTHVVSEIPACNSDETVSAVKEAIENNGGSRLQTIEVQDFGKMVETWMEPGSNIRRCVAAAILNTGSTLITYQLFKGPSGKQMVQVQTGESAEMQYMMDTAKKDQFEKQNATDLQHSAN
jgi:hypothetical protein